MHAVSRPHRVATPAPVILVAWALMFLCSSTAGLAQQPDTSGAGNPTKAGNEWIGARYPPLPDGAAYHSGDNMYRWGVTMRNSPDGNHSLSMMEVRGREMVWLNRVVEKASDERSKKVVTGVLVPPRVPEDYALQLGICGTLRSEQSRARLKPSDVKVDPEIVAVIRREKVKVLTHVHQAWRADWDTGRFKEIDPEEIACLNNAIIGH